MSSDIVRKVRSPAQKQQPLTGCRGGGGSGGSFVAHTAHRDSLSLRRRNKEPLSSSYTPITGTATEMRDKAWITDSSAPRDEGGWGVGGKTNGTFTSRTRTDQNSFLVEMVTT